MYLTAATLSQDERAKSVEACLLLLDEAQDRRRELARAGGDGEYRHLDMSYKITLGKR
jgi:hypothetical protein